MDHAYPWEYEGEICQAQSDDGVEDEFYHHFVSTQSEFHRALPVLKDSQADSLAKVRAVS